MTESRTKSTSVETEGSSGEGSTAEGSTAASAGSGSAPAPQEVRPAPRGPRGDGQHEVRGRPRQQQQQQPLSGGYSGSWQQRGPTGMMAHLPPDAYQPAPGGLYYSGQSAGRAGVAAFTGGNMRDSIAAIWSRASPSGLAMHPAENFSGSFVYNGSGGNGPMAAAPTGQFTANLTGHFATTTELNVFRNQVGANPNEFAAYSHQPPAYPYVQWGAENGNSNAFTPYMEHADVVRGMENLKVNDTNNNGTVQLANSYINNKIVVEDDTSKSKNTAPKKMSWANVASQPAKPEPLVTKNKKPGVLAPPTMMSSSKSSNHDSGNNNGNVNNNSLNSNSSINDSSSSIQNDVDAKQQHGEVVVFEDRSSPPESSVPNSIIDASTVNEAGLGFARRGPRPPPPPFQPQTYENENTMNGLQGFRGRPTARDDVPSNYEPMQPSNVFNSPHLYHHQSSTHPVLEMLWTRNNYNPRAFELNTLNARYFVIKSFSEDDIHRSIKYDIWCSTDNGNRRLDRAFREREGKGPVYLFFSVNASGHFCGVAQMLSPVDNATASSGIWVQDKFKGKFSVKWIYVKDVPNGQLRHIRLENNENKPVTNSRDTQEVPPRKGALVLKIIHGYKHQTSIFDDFAYYERRQEEELHMKKAAAAAASGSSSHKDNNNRHYQSNQRSGREFQSRRQQQHANSSDQQRS